jgi:hypothetical protein
LVVSVAEARGQFGNAEKGGKSALGSLQPATKQRQ